MGAQICGDVGYGLHSSKSGSYEVWVRYQQVILGGSDLRGRIVGSYYGFDYHAWFSSIHPVTSLLDLPPSGNLVIALCTPSVLDALRRMKYFHFKFLCLQVTKSAGATSA